VVRPPGPVRKTDAHAPRLSQSDFDFNSTLMDSGEASGTGTEIDKFPNVAMYESPLPQGDVAANLQLRRHTRCAIAMHYGSPPPMTALKEDVCDGFVIGGSTTG